MVAVASKAASRKEFLEFMFVSMFFVNRDCMDRDCMDRGFVFVSRRSLEKVFQKVFPEVATPRFLGTLLHGPCQGITGSKARSERLVSLDFGGVTP